MLAALINSIVIFTLATFLGVALINRVPSALHTPLMSGANAISGITIVGALIVAGGGHIDHVQVYSVARKPSDPRCGPLVHERLEAIAASARAAGLPAAVYV